MVIPLSTYGQLCANHDSACVANLTTFTTLIEMIPSPAIYCLRIHERSMVHNVMG